MAPAGEEVEKLPISQNFRAEKRSNVWQRAVEKLSEIETKKRWRRERDSNPRYPEGYNDFRDRRLRPLSHLSAGDVF